MSPGVPTSQTDALRLSARTAAILLVFTIAFTALMALTYQATKAPIAASVQETRMRLIGELLPPASYDNVLLDDWVEIPAERLLGLDAPSRVYRARKAGAPVALLLETVAPDGYSGKIRLLVAVTAEGRVAGARVTEHKETPGLGDYIDPRKDRNKARPWITQFEGVGFAQVPAAQWKLAKDGGRFDYVTGATISARAVTKALGRALQFATDNRDRLYAAPAAAKP